MTIPVNEPTIQQLFSLRGKVALITGGCGHLGSAMARGLAEAGASVILTSRDEGKAKAAAAKLPREEGAVHFGLALDHMQPETLLASFAKAVAVAGKVDVLVNNGHEALGKDWTDVTAEEFARHLANAFQRNRHRRIVGMAMRHDILVEPVREAL